MNVPCLLDDIDIWTCPGLAKLLENADLFQRFREILGPRRTGIDGFFLVLTMCDENWGWVEAEKDDAGQLCIFGTLIVQAKKEYKPIEAKGSISGRKM